jgi:uncharacterized GH25 family protein
VPASDPTSVHARSSLTLQLLTDGKPVADAAISAVSESAILKGQAHKGRVTFKLDQAGAWLIKTVHMVRLPQGSEADWESYWVTLSLHTAGH